MLKIVEEYMDKYGMAACGDHIIAGVSGGADSVCLLAVLKELSHKKKFTLEAVHVNHMLRGAEADRDAAYVAELCKTWGIRLKTVSCNVEEYAGIHHLSLEEAGRKMRYEVLGRQAEAFEHTRIAVAHHADDQAETVLYQIFRGSSLKGAGGIRPVRGNIIRPLLCVTRAEIEQYLNEKKIQFCIDSTNLVDDYTRNKLRNKIIPYLVEEINTEAVSNINHLASDLQEGYDYIYSQAKNILKYAVAEEHKITFPVEVLEKEPSILRREALRMAMEMLSGTSKDITRKHIEATESLLFKQVSQKVSLPYCLMAFRDYEKLVLCGTDTENIRDFTYPFENCTPQDFSWEICDFDGEWKNITNDYTKILNYDKIYNTIEIRKRLPGDYITIAPDGKKKLLKAFFIDEKIPKESRDKIWLVAEGSHVLWIVGYRISEILKTTDTTRKVLKITIRRKEYEV